MFRAGEHDGAIRMHALNRFYRARRSGATRPDDIALPARLVAGRIRAFAPLAELHAPRALVVWRLSDTRPLT